MFTNFKQKYILNFYFFFMPRKNYLNLRAQFLEASGTLNSFLVCILTSVLYSEMTRMVLYIDTRKDSATIQMAKTLTKSSHS